MNKSIDIKIECKCIKHINRQMEEETRRMIGPDKQMHAHYYKEILSTCFLNINKNCNSLSNPLKKKSI